MGKIDEIVGQAIGEASMLWSETPKGVFNSSRGIEIKNEVKLAIRDEILKETLKCISGADFVRGIKEIFED
jgi:hypothetical protein